MRSRLELAIAKPSKTEILVRPNTPSTDDDHPPCCRDSRHDTSDVGLPSPTEGGKKRSDNPPMPENCVMKTHCPSGL